MDFGQTKRRQEEAAFLTRLFGKQFPTADPSIEVKRLERGEAREDPADRYRVTVEFTAPTGSRETFITSSRNVYRDDDPGIERLAERLHERFERQQLQKRQQEEYATG